jgi:hypothetical protein
MGTDRALRSYLVRASEPVLAELPEDLAVAAGRLLPPRVRKASQLSKRTNDLVIGPCGPVRLDAIVTGFENMFFTDQVDHSHAYKDALVAFGNNNQREDHANL